MQKNCSLINFENLREYITRRDQIFGKRQVFKACRKLINNLRKQKELERLELQSERNSIVRNRPGKRH